MVLCVTLLLLINSSNFRICHFFVKSEDFLYKFSWIFSTRWNASGVIDSKILPLNCLLLFLNLSCKTWLICFCSCKISFPAQCKNIFFCSVLILLFSCRCFDRILLWWQWRKNRRWLIYYEYLIVAFSVQVCIYPLNIYDIIIHIARWWRCSFSKCNLIKLTCSWRDKLIAENIKNIVGIL